MLVKPYNQKGIEGISWFRIPKPHNPDKDLMDYARQKGEFSLTARIAFDKHLIKLNNLLNYYKRNFKDLLFEEPVWH